MMQTMELYGKPGYVVAEEELINLYLRENLMGGGCLTPCWDLHHVVECAKEFLEKYEEIINPMPTADGWAVDYEGIKIENESLPRVWAEAIYLRMEALNDSAKKTDS